MPKTAACARRSVLPALAAAAILGGGLTVSAEAEVRFGRNVRVGGHDFSNRTYDRNNRAVIHLFDRSPRREGCRWQSDGRGGRVQVCHLRRLRR